MDFFQSGGIVVEQTRAYLVEGSYHFVEVSGLIKSVIRDTFKSFLNAHGSIDLRFRKVISVFSELLDKGTDAVKVIGK